MRILISGSTGFIGSALVAFLKSKEHSITRLVRAKSGLGDHEILWNPIARVLDAKQMEGLDAVVHLAGDPVAQGRWTPEKKARIRDSRVKGTRFLAESVAQLARPPKIFLCASAIGIYGDRGEEVLSEESAPGTGFLARTGVEWERACEPAVQKGLRVVHLRTGMVLSPKDGALRQMLPPFRLGLGGVLGDGRQYMSWISLPDEIAAIHHALNTDSLRGPVNLVSPNSVTNREFTKTLGAVLRRPTFLSIPAFAVRLLFGEMGQELLLASTRVEPRRLKSTGYRFQHADLDSAFRSLLVWPRALP
jgi:uncharacterized protein